MNQITMGQNGTIGKCTIAQARNRYPGHTHTAKRSLFTVGRGLVTGTTPLYIRNIDIHITDSF
jgi:hypothetical protein